MAGQTSISAKVSELLREYRETGQIGALTPKSLKEARKHAAELALGHARKLQKGRRKRKGRATLAAELSRGPM